MEEVLGAEPSATQLSFDLDPIRVAVEGPVRARDVDGRADRDECDRVATWVMPDLEAGDSQAGGRESKRGQCQAHGSPDCQVVRSRCGSCRGPALGDRVHRARYFDSECARDARNQARVVDRADRVAHSVRFDVSDDGLAFIVRDLEG